MSVLRSLGFCMMLASAIACGGGGQSITPGKMPENGTYTGVFYSTQYGEMHMVQDGSTVHGRYELDERSGTIQGEVDGDVLNFEWVENKAMVSNRPTETRGHGYFRYMIDKSNGDHVLKGRWGLGDDNYNGGEWNAYKMKNREPDLGSSSGGDDGDFSDDSDFDDSEDSEETGDDLF